MALQNTKAVIHTFHVFFKLMLFFPREGSKLLSQWFKAQFKSIIAVSDDYPLLIRIPFQFVQYVLGLLFVGFEFLTDFYAGYLLIPSLFIGVSVYKLVQWITEGRQQKLMEDHLQKMINEGADPDQLIHNARIAFITENGDTINAASDEAIFQRVASDNPGLLPNTLLEYKTLVRTHFTGQFNLDYHGIRKIAFIIMAFREQSKQGGSFLGGILRSLAELIIVPLSMIAELAKYTIMSAFMILVCAAALVVAIPLHLLNVPMHIWDYLTSDNPIPPPQDMPADSHDQPQLEGDSPELMNQSGLRPQPARSLSTDSESTQEFPNYQPVLGKSVENNHSVQASAVNFLPTA